MRPTEEEEERQSNGSLIPPSLTPPPPACYLAGVLQTVLSLEMLKIGTGFHVRDKATEKSEKIGILAHRRSLAAVQDREPRVRL